MIVKLVKRFIKLFLPRPVILKLERWLKFTVLDFLTSKKSNLTPPGRILYTGGDPTNYEQIGEEFFEYFKKLGNVKPNSVILDIGSGLGRMAAPFTEFMDKQEGKYFGFDIVPAGVKWCTDKISNKYPNFRFDLADIYNKEYNPKGKLKAKEFVYPYDSNYFDFAFATSVFTHMYMEDIEQYVKELSRVLKPGGKCLLTAFLMNDNSKSQIAKDKAIFTFSHPIEKIFAEDKSCPEAAISLDEKMFTDLLSNNSIKIVEPIHYGSWCGREQFLSGQDIIIGEKI